MNTTRHPTTITAQPGTPFLEVVRDFDAPREVVFRATTGDVRTGGGYAYVHYTEGDDFEARFNGVYHKVVPGELVIQTLEFDGAPDEVCIETARYEDLDGGRTRLTTRSVFPSNEALEMAVESGMNTGICESMDRLAELLERLG